MIAEVRDLPSRTFIFVDDNLTADRDYAKRLFAALKPLRKRWVTQSTLAIADDPDLVRMMAEAGCIGIFAGLETFSGDNLGSVQQDMPSRRTVSRSDPAPASSWNHRGGGNRVRL